MMSTSDTPPERKAFKDWFDAEAADQLATQVKAAWPEFDSTRFCEIATTDLSSLEFQTRVNQFAEALRSTLPDEVPRALEILVSSLPPARSDCEDVSDGWLQWPIGNFIAHYATEHLDAALETMTELTTRFTSEFAVRPYIELYPDQVFAHLQQLTRSENPHHRRWCSEGPRPLLPWGRKLHALVVDPSPLLPILEALKDDEELYVRRSVANNLNDIAKDHPNLVVSVCRNWLEHPTDDRRWLVKHALRTLIKDGHPGALELMGFLPPQKIQVKLNLEPAVLSIGESTLMSAEIGNKSNHSQNLVVDYAVHYVRKGDKTSAKVFKWKTLELPAGETIELEKNHPMKPTTVRALYPGIHRVELQINGVRLAETSFELK